MDGELHAKFWWDTTSVDTDYATHGLHPYPAKFIPQIPQRAIDLFTEPGDTVLDPFCGCGTTLVEAKLAGRNAVGTDVNPIATHISKVKSTPIDESTLAAVPPLLDEIRADVAGLYTDSFGDGVIDYERPEFHNRDHWFEEHVQHELAVILAHLRTVEDADLRDFLTACLSAIIVKVSNQESDTRYAAKDIDIAEEETVTEFIASVERNLEGIRYLTEHAGDGTVDVYDMDARNVEALDDDSVDLVVTSPPYANTYDYYLYHKMRMFWLGMDYREAQAAEIGSRYKYSSQKEDPETFFGNIADSLAEMERVLKPGAEAVFIIGDSVIRGDFFEMDEKIEEICRDRSLTVVSQIEQELSTYTSFNKSFGSQEKHEYIIFLENRA